jgi:DNA-binding CsgD family transcriptional regulator
MYVCSRCGTPQELRTRGSTLKRCPNCRGTLFRKAKPSKKSKRRGTTVLRDLTPRETELLRLLATEGLTNRKLGERLGIAPATVRTHLDHARVKLRVHNRVQLALAAQRLGIARV